jgi:hypothetical protein
MVPYGYGGMRASTADRERAVDVLKAAFAEGRLDQDEYADRVGQAYASRTYGELAALTADLPVGPLGSVPPAPHQPMPAPPGPFGMAPYMSPYVPVPPPPPMRPAERQTDNMAIAAFVFALGAYVTAGLTAPVALGLAVGAAFRMRRSGDVGNGLAVAAVVLAALSLLLIHPLWLWL